MSVKEIDTVVILFPNEEWGDTATDAELDAVVAQLRPNISYALFLNENLQTLSTNDADESGTISGFLYVPDLDRHDPCYDISDEYLPKNVTRRANLPPTDFTLIALAPWISPECTLAYLDAGRRAPMRAFIFYLPDNSTTQPPPVSSQSWDLGDAGRWKAASPYPVYAVPGAIGQELMYQSSLYSGNITSVPYGHQISELPGIDPRDYVRIYTEIHVSTSSPMPSLWVLLLIIVAVLFFMLGATSVAMHLILRSRRNSLRRRVARGEVDLEALGIKRLTVPQEFIDRLPLFTYDCEEEKLPSAFSTRNNNSTSNTSAVERDNRSEGSSSSAKLPSNTREVPPAPLSPVSAVEDIVSSPESVLAHKYLPYSQPTCPICLDDFESGITPIRELPCGHIFHPACIDSFLANNSSLCPMCKTSILPKGYCPEKITNAMVRRERNIRQLRSRVMVNDTEGDAEPDNLRNRMRQLRSNIRRVLPNPTTAPREEPEQIPVPLEPHPVFMTNSITANSQVSVLGNEVFENLSPGLTREDIDPQRIHDLAARQSSLDGSEVADDGRRPKWRKSLAKVFPGFT